MKVLANSLSWIVDEMNVLRGPAEREVLEAVLRNPEPGQYLSLISSRELAADRDALEKAFALIKSPPPRMRMSIFDFGYMINEHINKKDDIDKHLQLAPANTVSKEHWLGGTAHRAV